MPSFSRHAKWLLNDICRTVQHFTRLFALSGLALGALELFVVDAQAADLESNLTALVGAIVRKVFPILGLYFVAEAAFLFVQGHPDASRRIKTVALGLVGLLGINSAWSWLSGLIR
jgi:hypothetical protein